MITVADEKWKDSWFLLGFSVICCSLCKHPRGENATFCFDDATVAFLRGFCKTEGIISMYCYPISSWECIPDFLLIF